MSTINRNNTPVSSSVPPNFRESVIMRIKSAAFGVSKGSGNAQVVVNAEIVKPLDYKASDGKTYILDAQEFTYYFPMKATGKMTEKEVHDNYLAFLETLGLPAEFDPENVNTENLPGVCFQALVGSQEDIPQRKDEKGQWVALLGGDGKPLKMGKHKWVNFSKEIIGRVEMEAAAAKY